MDRSTDHNQLQTLCLNCGLCCNGVLFADVRLEHGESVQRLRELGIQLQCRQTVHRFKQPCAALNGCKCRIYDDRPAHCRTFECLLFKRVKAGSIGLREAKIAVKKARAGVGKVERLLLRLGDGDTHLPLRRRFQRQMRAKDDGLPATKRAALMSELSLAMHQLTRLLSRDFYE